MPWYPVKGESNADVVAVCATCPVIAECLHAALGLGDEQREVFGVWGGASDRVRRRMRTAIRRGADPDDLIAAHVQQVRLLSGDLLRRSLADAESA